MSTLEDASVRNGEKKKTRTNKSDLIYIRKVYVGTRRARPDNFPIYSLLREVAV